MLAQVFGSTTNNTNNYNNQQTQFLNSYYAQFDNIVARASVDLGQNQEIFSVFGPVSESELTINSGGLTSIIPNLFTYYTGWPGALGGLVAALVANGIYTGWLAQYKLYFFNVVNPNTGAVWTDADIVAAGTGWNLAQVTAMHNYESYIYTNNIPDMIKSLQATMRNTSATQNIRIGSAPSFAVGAVKGMLLSPGDVWVLEKFNFALNGISDVDGATLSVFILQNP